MFKYKQYAFVLILTDDMYLFLTEIVTCCNGHKMRQHRDCDLPLTTTDTNLRSWSA